MPLSGSGAASFFDVSDTTATASDVASGKYFYNANGVKTEGTASIGGVTVVETSDSHGGTIVEITGVQSVNALKYGVIRPDATLVKTFSYDKYIVADEGITIPAYTTTSTTLKATEALSETYTVDYANYDYYILMRGLTIPTYSVTTKAKGRTEYHWTEAMYELAEISANTMAALLDTTKKVTTVTAGLVNCATWSRLVYWSSGSAVAAYSTTAYGCTEAPVAPTLSNGIITFNTPNFIIRGSSTYLSSTYMNAITDIRYQWIIEVYRASKNNFNIDGWGHKSQALHILECVSSSNQKLT